ncbi:hypothetical protein ABZY19_38985 [Streptomyces sp. NPDC006475]
MLAVILYPFASITARFPVIRVSPRTLARRRIMCGECQEDFAAEEPAE